MNERYKIIIECIEKLYSKYRNHTDNVSKQTINSINICKDWQKEIKDKYEKSVEIEKKVGCSSEKIDLVDMENMVAYELKVSGKNAHHEFYKDLIKVFSYNLQTDDKKIKELIFITEEAGIDNIRKRLCIGKTDKIKQELGNKLGIKITLVKVPNNR